MLEFFVENQNVSRQDQFKTVADSKNYLKAHFVLSEEWTDDTAVLFGYGDECFCVLLDENNCCIVPYEVIKPPFFTVSLFCGDETFVTTNIAIVEVEKSGFAVGKIPESPSPDIWQQYLNKINVFLKKCAPYVGENSNWFLYNPESDAYEDSGMSAVGTTPVRGDDYWTEADKTEIVNSVLESLPDADTMNFPLGETVSEVSEE